MHLMIPRTSLLIRMMIAALSLFLALQSVSTQTSIKTTVSRKSGTGQEIFASSMITAVQLYSNQAMITRRARVRLKKGQNLIRIAGLPARMRSDSVKIRIRGTSGSKINEIRTESRHKKQFRSTEAEVADQRLRKAEAKLATLTDRYKILRREEKHLRKIKLAPFRRSKDRQRLTPPNPERWQETLNYIASSLRENHLSRSKLLKRVDRAREDLAVALAAAERYRQSISISSQDLHIGIESKYSARTVIEFDYLVNNAGWYPVYTARVKARGDTARVRLLSYALISNKTGEDWKNVRLSFSAADPMESASLPQLYSWKIESRTVAVSGTGKKIPGGSMSRSRSKNDKIRPASRRRAEGRKGKFFPKKKVRRHRIARSSSRGGYGYRRMPSQSPVQQKFNQNYNRANRLYSKNKRAIREQEARTESDRAGSYLRKLRRSRMAQEKALIKNRYKEALRHSERVLESIGNLRLSQRKYFKTDLLRARRIKRLSLRALEQNRFVGKLVNPRVSSRGFDYRYKARGTETVRSDGSFHKALIGDQTLDADLFFATTPLRKKLAFLAGKVRYRGENPLLAGPVAVFHNTDFVGDVSLATIAPREAFKLNLGNDANIEIRRRIKDFSSVSGIITKTKTIARTVTITLINRRNKAIKLYVFDRIPAAGNDQVSIEDIRTNISPDKYQKDFGLYRFRIYLSPGQKRELIIRYKIKFDEGYIPQYIEGRKPLW